MDNVVAAKPVLCVFCRRPVMTTYVSGYGTSWTHADGYRECAPTYAAPSLIDYGAKV